MIPSFRLSWLVLVSLLFWPPDYRSSRHLASRYCETNVLIDNISQRTITILSLGSANANHYRSPPEFAAIIRANLACSGFASPGPNTAFTVDSTGLATADSMVSNMWRFERSEGAVARQQAARHKEETTNGERMHQVRNIFQATQSG